MKTFDSRTGYDLYAPNYRQDYEHLDSFDWAETQPRLAHYLSTIMASHHDQPVRLLDLGCGDGRILRRLVRLSEQRSWTNRLELHGWDISEGMLKQARKAVPGVLSLECRDLLDSASCTTHFELICSFFVLVHITRTRDFLTAAASLLTPDGIFIFNSIPQKKALVLERGGKRFQIEYEHHETSEILGELSYAGLELVEHMSTEWSEVFAVRKGSPALSAGTSTCFAQHESLNVTARRGASDL